MTFLSTLGAITSSSGAGAVALGLLVLLVILALVVLNYVAIFKIITKAGYSGWWILIPLSPPIAYGISYAAVSHEISNYNSYGDSADFWRQIVGWLVLVGISYLIQWVFFYIFAFSDWPVRRQLRRATTIPYDVPIFQDVQSPVIAQSTPTPGAHTPALHTPQSDSSGLLCTRCGAALTDGKQFCESCGHPTSVVPIPAAMSTSSVDPIPAADPTPTPAPTPAPAPAPAPPRFWEDQSGGLEVVPSYESTPPGDSSVRTHRDPGLASPGSHCRACNHPLEVGSVFCGGCGARIDAT